MSDHPAPASRSGDPHPGLRIVALAAVILGVVLLAAAAFVLSYSGIHHIALRAGVTPALARVYPGIFDAMLVMACAAALALRGARWWMRAYVWLSLLLLFAAVAAGDAVHAMNIALPRQPSRAAIAVAPWVLLLLAFGLWLAMLRHLRTPRSHRTRDAAPGGHGDDSPAGTGVLATPSPATTGPTASAHQDTGEPTAGLALHDTGEPAAGPDDTGGPSAADSTDELVAGPAPGDAGELTAGTPAGDSGEETGPPHTGGHSHQAAGDSGPADSPDSAEPAGESARGPSFDRLRSSPTPPQE